MFPHITEPKSYILNDGDLKTAIRKASWMMPGGILTRCQSRLYSGRKDTSARVSFSGVLKSCGSFTNKPGIFVAHKLPKCPALKPPIGYLTFAHQRKKPPFIPF